MRKDLQQRMAGEPVSRILCPSPDASGYQNDGHSSGPRIAARLLRPTRGLTSRPLRGAITGRTSPPLLFGLAPRGVYLAPDVAIRAVGSYPTVSPLPNASHEWGAA